jgi:hypothetical protein
VTIPQYVSPLEAIDLAYDFPLELPEHLRVTLAYLARHYPNICPKRESMALRLGIQAHALEDRLHELRMRGLMTTIIVGARHSRRTYRILHLPDLPLTIPAPVEHTRQAESLRIMDAMADADSQADGGDTRFILMRGMLKAAALATS